MSNRYRNPFKIRATEKLESESNFLRMYSPYVLDELLEKNKIGKLWNNILFIRSSPGAGKTSMLKVLESSSLLTLSNNPTAPDYEEIIRYLKKLDVIDNSGNVHMLGVYISCARNYGLIEDLEISEGQKKGLFFALINARVILSTLRSLVSLNPTLELEDVQLNASSFDYSYLDIQFPINGNQLFEWAANIEKAVFKAIDSFLPLKENVHGHHELFAFGLMQPGNFSIKNKKMVEKILFMFDDAHKLSKTQRESFIDFLTVKRADYNIWIAERLEALDEQRNFGSIKDRDYDEINLEQIWQGTNNKLRNIVASVADKRASMSSEDVRSFQVFLEDRVKESEYESKYLKAFDQSISNLILQSGFNYKFEHWIKYLKEKSQDITPNEKAILSRQVEILIHRHVGKSQLTFEFPLTVEELNEKLDRDTQTTASYLVAIEQKIPFYYGFDNLVKLSSNNIDQFLTFAAELFELMLARKISDKPINIDAAEQEKLLKKIAENKWREQITLVPNSEKVLKFLQNAAGFAQKETNRPNAPYPPGVNGFAIKEPAEKRLIEGQPWREDAAYKPLMSILKTCLAYNLLEKRTTKQGKVNNIVTVYYLNRWICLRFNLPLSYGSFRHRSPADLLKWTK